MSELFSQIDKLDRKLTLTINEWRTDILTLVLRVFTESARGYAWAIYVIIINLLQLRNIKLFEEQSLLQKAMFAPLIAWALGRLIKVFFKRKRPFQAIKNFQALTHSPINDSFPSLHTTSTISFCTALVLLHHPFGPWILIWALIVSFSRLYLGVHYLSDLLGGMLLGIFSGCFLINFF